MTAKTLKKFSRTYIGELFNPDSGGFEAAYPNLLLEEIFKDLKITDNQKKVVMKDAILNAASAFEMGKHNYLSWYKTSSEIKSLMKDLYQSTESAANTYKKILSHITYRMHLMSHLIKEFDVNNQIGFPMVQKSGDKTNVYEQPALDFLDFLAKASKSAAINPKDINPATSPSYAMDRWIDEIYKGWKDCSSIPFTAGKPYARIGYNSQAIITLRKIMLPLDRVVTKEMISTALRKAQNKYK